MTGASAALAEPIVSVIIANYNAAPFIEACLRSVLASDLADIEVVLVDDLSSDEGLALARAIAATDPRLRVIARDTNGGPAAVRNQALAQARGHWVAIVDSDDLVHPRRFTTLVAAGEASGAAIVADDQLVFDDGVASPPRRFLKPADRTEPIRLDLDSYLNRAVLYGPEPDPGFLKPLIRRDRLMSARVLYDETLRIAEDTDFAIRLLLAGLDYLVVPEPLYFYRKHGRSISHRLSLAAVEAMRAADRALSARVMSAYPALAKRCRARARALDRVAALERLIAALKQRRPIAAAAELVRNPAVIPLLRMPIMGLAGKLRGSAPPATLSPADQFKHLLADADAA
ncbi:succinoglycan biosynthesis protein ExoO [Sphingomonas guangdongensis]|uniref:Succinoglycan biosynthesis protein ExoO n=1 Tax=Sphingomonas guangdongensis TaxID=1141890 RepID=A0A285QGV3_9SPHN|nr:glycosyltransferase family 2 protein [Sphingomonas guangdongensis]SOB81076.1 succinoglycan biosynthesis protein ExoO [Sphingomonas guangdongensis]